MIPVAASGVTVNPDTPVGCDGNSPSRVDDHLSMPIGPNHCQAEYLEIAKRGPHSTQATPPSHQHTPQPTHPTSGHDHCVEHCRALKGSDSPALTPPAASGLALASGCTGVTVNPDTPAESVAGGHACGGEGPTPLDSTSPLALTSRTASTERPTQTHQQQDLQLRIVTANTTAWSSAKQWLTALPSESRPHLLFLQEHKLRGTQAIDEATAFGTGLGYTSLWTQAGAGPAGTPAGGTAILAVKQLGLISPRLPRGVHPSQRTTLGGR